MKFTENMCKEQFRGYDKKEFINYIIERLQKKGIVFGIDLQEALRNIQLQTRIKVANGNKPIKGKDAQITIESEKGKIVGGCMEAGIKIEAGSLGNRSETPTEEFSLDLQVLHIYKDDKLNIS